MSDEATGGPSDASRAPGHEHHHHTDRDSRSRGRLAWVFGITLTFFAVEVVAAIATDSLALLGDAGHMLTDAVALGMALAAIAVADRAGVGGHRTFGLYRLEILAALANAVLLLGVAAYLIWEATHRLGDPPEMASGTMLAVAIAGLATNVAGVLLLRRDARTSLNLRAAYLDVLADAAGSLGVILAAAAILLWDWHEADPLAALVIGLAVIPRTLRLAGQAIHILVQAAPGHLDLDKMHRSLAGIAGVVDVHDLHVWTLTSSMDVASAHLRVADGTDTHGVLDQARHVLHERFGIEHATVQVEPQSHQGCDELSW